MYSKFLQTSTLKYILLGLTALSPLIPHNQVYAQTNVTHPNCNDQCWAEMPKCKHAHTAITKSACIEEHDECYIHCTNPPSGPASSW